ncbi:hypothetical protein [Pseudoruegeria sp. SHC-113]|uniref:hypothetical protein n=1 Tax=Pseudoruegeria sp. SHC-113 TaxID=2855439 RepID=UPI0021BAE4ED|nr:hypothetical protein [Pseudoruegeria sp. SHC-113]MCT8160631.1 hypothetical protein [Pseudoruegeria sp. SHC-113]
MSFQRDCDTCYHWKPHRRSHNRTDEAAECMLMPPDVSGKRPRTKGTDYCGQWHWKDDKPPKALYTLKAKVVGSLPGAVISGGARMLSGGVSGYISAEGFVYRALPEDEVELVGYLEGWQEGTAQPRFSPLVTISPTLFEDDGGGESGPGEGQEG